MTQYQLPAHLLNRQSKTVGQTLQNNLGKNNPPHLSIEGGRFTLVDAVGNEQPVQTFDPQLGPYIDINIIDVNDHISKIYWGDGNQYNPNAQSYLPPLCFSDNGVGPSRNASEPQSPTCAQCPNNVWGSATSRITGKGIKACSDLQKIAFTTPGHSTVFVLRIPPNSLKNMGLHQGTFNGTGIDISDVITRVSFVPGIQGTLQFQGIGYIDETTAAQREQALANKATDGLIGRFDVVHPGAAALGGPPAQQAVLPAPAVAPAAWISEQSSGVGAAVVQPVAGNAPPFVVAQNAAPPQGQPSVQPVAGQASASTKRRGRPPAQAATPQGQPVQAPFPTSQPPASAPTQQAAQGSPVPNGAAPGHAFGIMPGVAPNPEISAVLGNLFPGQQRS